MSGPFHPDELKAQALAGVAASGAGIRPFMPDQHREFFTVLPYLFIATADARGWPVAGLWSGAPGFVHSPDPTTLRVDTPAHELAAGAEVGLLGLDLTNRRRNRANGHVVTADESGLMIRVRQSFGNCAQYIQTRMPTPHPRQADPVQTLSRLHQAARRLIASADTFFVASRSRSGIDAGGGLDMSHRGGRPGFIDIHGETLVIPDFRGNRFFNTLGNLLGDPRASLLFVDFDSGDLLQLQGSVEIDWSGDAHMAGAQRTWRFRTEHGQRRPGAIPFAWTFGDYASTTLATGISRSSSAA